VVKNRPFLEQIPIGADSHRVLSEIVFFAIAFAVAFPLLYAYLRRQQEPEWEARWNQLPQAQRQHIKDAVQRGEPLADPEEAELGAGFARQQRAASALFSQTRIVHLVLATILLLVALVGGSPLLLVLIALLLAFLIWVAYRERLTKRNLERAEAASSQRWS
jgi:Flp pilus assembly protein TadB